MSATAADYLASTLALAAPDQPDCWAAVAPSAVAFHTDYVSPVALDREGLARVRDGFAAVARRAAELGTDVIQIHAAHGYRLPGAAGAHRAVPPSTCPASRRDTSSCFAQNGD